MMDFDPELAPPVEGQPSPLGPTPAADPGQRELVLGARERWVRRLIDPSRSNSLLFYRDLSVGTLDLTELPDAVERLLAGNRVDIDELVGGIEPPATITTPSDREIARRVLEEEKQLKVQRSLVALQRKSLSNLEERGLETLFLALGLGRWPAADGGRPYDAPILLFPALIEAKGGRIDQGIHFRLFGEPRVNPVLLYILEHEFRVIIDPEDLLRAYTTEDEAGRWSVDIESIYRFVEQRCIDAVREFRVRRRAILAARGRSRLLQAGHR